MEEERKCNFCKRLSENIDKSFTFVCKDEVIYICEGCIYKYKILDNY
jgi:hypothetical protein